MSPHERAPDPLTLLATGEIRLAGRLPWSSNATFLVEVETVAVCCRAVYKPVRGERPLWDFPPGLHRRETAAYELSAWLGWGLVPPTVLRTDGPLGEGSLQLFVPVDYEEHYFTLVEDPARHPALQAVCAFDLVANNTDRKSGHCLAGADGQVWAIDNGLCFAAEPKLRTVIWDFAGEPVPDALLDDLSRLAGGAPPALDDLLAPAERDALVRRARRLCDRPVFPTDRSGRAYPWPLV